MFEFTYAPKIKLLKPEGSMPPWFRREGEFLVVRNGAVLPDRCIHTGRLLSETEAKTRTLVWRPKWVLASASLLGLGALYVLLKPLPALAEKAKFLVLFLWFAFNFQERSLTFTFALSHRVHVQWMMTQVIPGLLFTVWMFFLIFYGGAKDTLIGRIGLPLAIGGLMALNVCHLLFPLRIAFVRDGEFWLKGASPAFLDSLEEREGFSESETSGHFSQLA